jgi:hypothetical protein
MKLSKREPKHMGEVMSDIAERYDKLTKTKMSKKLTLNERYIIAQSVDDFENTWNDHTEFDDMEVPRLRSELTEEQLKLLNQNKDE